MKFEPFLLERFQSLYEHRVRVNLSESGVEPLTIRELLGGAPDLEAELLTQPLGYTQTNGTEPLRSAIAAALYPGADASHVQVTSGGSEANLLLCLRMVEPGDEVVVMLPNYMQTWGLVRGLGAEPVGWPLRYSPSAGWRPDLDELQRLVRPRTRLILICNPNNPTGSCLRAEELDAICRIADRHGVWVHSDEIYRGAERELPAESTATIWGRYERALVTGGLSKAYGLPGLRIGWLAGPVQEIEACWGLRDYTSIAPNAISDQLARLALGERRGWILERTRAIVQGNWTLLQRWLSQTDELSCAAPDAGAIGFIRYRQPVNSTQLAERLRAEHSVLIVPGDHYGLDGHFRIGFGGHADPLLAGLQVIRQTLRTVAAT